MLQRQDSSLAARFVAVACLACCVAFPAAADSSSAPEAFARVDTTSAGAPRALQMAIVSYRASAAGSPTVDLIGAVHVADRGYYAELNQRFRDYDTVLYELVVPEAGALPRTDAAQGGVVSSTQRLMTALLGLEFQLDEIDYRAPNLVHADLSASEFGQRMADRGESLYVYFWRAFYASIRQASRDPLGLGDLTTLATTLSGSSLSFKATLAYELTRVDALSDMLDGDDGSAIIAARNERAIEVLERRLAMGDERIGIFYGVAHMPDFARRLAARGFRPVRTRWVDAWRLEDDPDTLPPR